MKLFRVRVMLMKWKFIIAPNEQRAKEIALKNGGHSPDKMAQTRCIEYPLDKEQILPEDWKG